MQNSLSQPNKSGLNLWLLVLGIWVLAMVTRYLGPNDLWDKEQPRTIAYTVDMYRHGNFILPYDAFGIPATKPPFYNWLSLPFVATLGFADWVHRIPAMLSSLAVIITLFLYGRTVQPRLEGGTGVSPWLLGAIASLMWIATPPTLRLSYVARPDMPLVALLTGAWAAASVMIYSDRSRPGMAAIFWLCTLGAAIDKGPLALFAIAYLVIAALLINRSPRVLLRSGWWWGLPLLIVGSGLWVYGAYQQEPEYITKVLFGHEVGMRFDPGESLQTFINSPTYPITGLLPWSILVIGVLILVGPRKWFSHPLAPAIIWLLLFTVGMAFTAHRRRDWYAPVYPQMTIPAAAVILGLMFRTSGKKFALRAGHVMAFAIVYAAILVAVDWTKSTYARTKWGDNAQDFVAELRKKIGDEPVIFLDGERTGIESVLGIQQQEPPSPELLANAVWCIKNYEPPSPEFTTLTDAPVLISEPLYNGEQDVDQNGKLRRKLYVFRLGLYRIQPGQGVAEYALHQKIPVVYDRNEGMALSPDGSLRKYARFWRRYETTSSTQAATIPATTSSPAESRPDR